MRSCDRHSVCMLTADVLRFLSGLHGPRRWRATPQSQCVPLCRHQISHRRAYIHVQSRQLSADWAMPQCTALSRCLLRLQTSGGGGGVRARSLACAAAWRGCEHGRGSSSSSSKAAFRGVCVTCQQYAGIQPISCIANVAALHCRWL